jgi:hypothetical protein
VSEQLADWPRRFHQGQGGKPFLFYAVFGGFPEMPALSREEYRSNGVFPGLQLSHYDRGKHPEVLGGFRQGYPWDDLKRHRAALADAVQEASECLILRGELEDQNDLNYLRDAVGLVTFLLDHGGVVVYDPQMFHWWERGEWRDRIFRPAGTVPRHHAVILTSEEPDDASLTWFHTRGLRKFGRPDLSVHRVPPQYRDAVIDLFEWFIEFQAFGGVIEEGQEVRVKMLPRGMTCHHAGDLDDPDFNNVHRVARKDRLLTPHPSCHRLEDLLVTRARTTTAPGPDEPPPPIDAASKFGHDQPRGERRGHLPRQASQGRQFAGRGREAPRFRHDVQVMEGPGEGHAVHGPGPHLLWQRPVTALAGGGEVEPLAGQHDRRNTRSR